jgi:hypothetical protein
MKKTIKCFDTVFDGTRPHIVMDAGLRVIEIRRITGTVDKCGELDTGFRYIRRNDRQEMSRRFHMAVAMERFEFMPPIIVYLFQGEYFIVDGHRRVSTAIRMKVEYIDAVVREFVYRDDTIGMRGALSRRRFETQTGLKSINLTYEIGYQTLLREIEEYPGKEIGKRARMWYTDTYLPAYREIRASVLPMKYRELRTGDIYVLIVDFFVKYMGGIPEGVGFATCISGFLFAHGITQNRFFRGFPFRLIGRLLYGKAARMKTP